MSALTATELTDLLADAAGPADVPAGSASFMTTDFSDLGYDSLAVLETLTLVQSRWGVALSDDVVAGARTPASLLVLLNRELAAA